MLKKFFKILGIIIAVMVLVILFNTFNYKSKQVSVPLVSKIAIDDLPVQHLSEAVKIKTISYEDPAKFDTTNFDRFLNFLHITYPLCDSLLKKTSINHYSLLYKWEGSDANLKPVILLGHMDVVPPGDETKWTLPAFSGEIKDGFVWGRGSMDDKVNVIGVLESVEALLKQGFKPRRTFYLAFGHDEEIGGQNGAVKIVDYLEAQHVKAEFVIDEGLVITKDIVPGITKPVALIGISEKGYLSVELSVEMEGGHSSMPAKETPIGILSTAISKLESNKFKTRISEPVKQFLDYAGPEMSFFSKMAFSNQWLFKGIIISKYENTLSGSALIRTTTAPTIFKSGVKDNVLPAIATATVNFRILPGESIKEVLEHIRTVVNDDRVSVKQLGHSNEPSPVSEVNSVSFQAIVKSIKQIFDTTITAPSLMVGATDSRHYTNVTSNAYRFTPMLLHSEDLKRLHGLNERLSTENFKDCIRFYIQLIQNSSAMDSQ